MAYGMLSHAMLQFQGSFGTPLTTSLNAIAIVDESITITKEPIVEAGMYARLGESPYHEGLAQVEGDLSLEANPTALGYLFRFAVGSVSVTSDTNKQTHLFKMRTSDHSNNAATDPMTIELYRDQGSAAVYYDLCANNLSFNVTNGELVNATLGVLGAGFYKKAAGSPTFPTAAPFKWDQFSASFGGAALEDIQDLTITINNNLEARHTLANTNSPQRVKRTGMQTIELTGTVTFLQQSLWDAFLNQDETQFICNFKTAQTPNELTFDFPKLRYKAFDPVVNGAGMIEASFTAGAMFSTDSNTAMAVTLVNTQEAYL